MHHPTRVALAAVTVAALAATVAPAPWATAAPPSRSDDGIVAQNLDKPRQLSIGPDNRIYVAESGSGGDGPCQEGPEGPVCFGLTGAITEIKGATEKRFGKRTQKRVVRGLPSINGTGPSDVDVRGRNVAILIGLGGDKAFREGFGTAATTLGTLQTGRLGGKLTTTADLVTYEETNDPDGAGPDSNPAGLIARDAHRWAVADAGGNDLVGVGKRGQRTIGVFPNDRTAPAPSPGPWGAAGTLIPFQSVPTDVVKGPDGAFYVSELNGFPFPLGTSTIWRVVPGQKPKPYATGLSRVTSLDWRRNQLYAVQLFDADFLGPTGSVRKVVPGKSTHPAVAENLPNPYGIAIRGNTAYVTTDVLGPEGKVRAISLR